ncbi:MAG: hypothetical protein LIO92_03010 [Clostridiales bacterium]|nr:hypothetical protein [Clostridiales bacterium]
MNKWVYISADYDEENGDRSVVDTLHAWAKDKLHKVNFLDTAQVKSGSVSATKKDCRICDLKAEFNAQINQSSAVIIVIGDKTASRTAGSACQRNSKEYWKCYCTPYKDNAYGSKPCKAHVTYETNECGDVGNINTYSYIRHEFEQANKKNKNIIVVYNSLYRKTSWLPAYMRDYESEARPFWILDAAGNRVGNYAYIKEALGYE